jgi:hypothetical protein
MSALGQKRTCAPQTVMSALLPIATAKADSRKVVSALPPKTDVCGANHHDALGQKRTLATQNVMFALPSIVDLRQRTRDVREGQKETSS